MLLSAKRRAYFCKSITIEMGGVSRYFSNVSGSGVDYTLLIVGKCRRNALWSDGKVKTSRRSYRAFPAGPTSLDPIPSEPLPPDLIRI